MTLSKVFVTSNDWGLKRSGIESPAGGFMAIFCFFLLSKLGGEDEAMK